ncbi:ester cyclase (plasmid) [Aminobacter sp. SR38]|jgi:predicted ester cyclase|uniref:ester cyclase n=1 Tax=Hyphomicrobiales TaxID=356 RepID=UPI001786802F|nr:MULTISPECIES: ester cyclase [Hyphomicrobiales]MCZ7497383.1 ester cyclase [Rhizobium rhizogenes]MCZ7501876.1 ester cyclase [Rhizobium rhizogenes]QOF75337.1 ester cyclase [Aminobacter sp. SR38]
MSLDENKKLVQQFYDAINREKFEELDALCHKDFVFYSQVDTPKPGVAGFVNSEKSAFDAFKSFRFPLELMVAEGDRVAAYLIFEAKDQTLPTMGAEPHGKSCRISVFCLLTIKEGKIFEKRAHFDVADIRRQLAA